jgi:HCOMODA/2-hydroxy-3-carboxy-muconic semialdehyde decarboxylase
VADTRSLLATANQVLVREGVLDAYGHISVRDPTSPQAFLLARYLPPSLVSADDIRAFDFGGRLVIPEDCALYSERFIHAAVYHARPDVSAVCHTHAPDLVAFGIAGAEPGPVFHMAAGLGSRIPIFDDYDADSGLLISDLGQAHRVAAVLGTRTAALMRGHGAVVTGRSIEHVVMNAIYLVQNARIRLAAGGLGGQVRALTEQECQAAAAKIGRPASLRRAWSHFAGQAGEQPGPRR